MATTDLVLGIDIGGTTTTLGFVDKQGNILIETEILTLAHEHVTSFLPRLYDTIDKMREDLGKIINWLGIGIGAPNGNFYRGTIENPPNLQWGGVVNLVDLVKRQYNLPTLITNDANAAALGEMKFGAARQMRNFILITLGTGLGSGIVVNGDLVYGHSGFAGEMGHLTVNPEGRMCGCGRRGCLETYVSVTGIRRTVSKLLADSMTNSELRSISPQELTGKMIHHAALQGDKIALEAFQYTGDILGLKLAEAVAFSSPEAIILFGGLANAKEFILQPTLNSLERNLFSIFKGSVKLLMSELQDRNAAVLGAAGLIWHDLDKAK
ncbi:MAG: ROK family protein [Microscillaceae bacterium]|nr:ROK family protein [Microscillaceae bacterium]